MWISQRDNWVGDRILEARSGHVIFQSGNSRNRPSTHLLPRPLYILFPLLGTLFSSHFSRLILPHTSYLTPSVSFLKSLSLITWFKSGSSSNFLFSSAYLFSFLVHTTPCKYTLLVHLSFLPILSYKFHVCFVYRWTLSAHNKVAMWFSQGSAKEHTSYTCVRFIGENCLMPSEGCWGSSEIRKVGRQTAKAQPGTKAAALK